jgi:hypothetical protein
MKAISSMPGLPCGGSPPALCMVVAILCSGHSPAEIPIATQRAFQKASPEKLTLEIQKVEKRKTPLTVRMDVTAKALEVEASPSGLRKGDSITIIYSFPNDAFDFGVTGSWPGEVKEGKHYKAYLRQLEGKKKSYGPAAASGTFEAAVPPEP